jgi:PIN domain nuclease of toxin-antitoxin system
LPVLDTVILFAVADSKDQYHSSAINHMKNIRKKNYRLSAFALLEFDVVLKSRGISFNDRMEKVALLINDFPQVTRRMSSITPATIYLTARLEKELSMDYFDGGVASEALQSDGVVISTDRVFDRVPNLTRIW